jgi:hypothetical protein
MLIRPGCGRQAFTWSQIGCSGSPCRAVEHLGPSGASILLLVIAHAADLWFSWQVSDTVTGVDGLLT